MVLQISEKDFQSTLSVSSISFKIKVLKAFKISSDCHLKTCRSFKQRVILKILSTIFLEEPMLLLLT